MLLNQALDEKKMDYRLRDRLIQEGKIKKEEVDKFLANLEDCTDKKEDREVK